ncbi:MAG: hypothetical protein HOU81_05820 [Hamadaea sp.]|uniref:hypothetical protein n=1 Tax=Hamadaea sp. TaxID=2024425 RepID=UPI0017C17DC5|nr:hypothetical protein [Hamadaea sp.]NUR70316.1 hypothetical protein [Hamadaea sp.]NUS44915.1 hypothetical protein [Mycobacteriaceae bacterium]NUT21962.1 hypothetical protein [Hamadaea sp.]
MNDLAAEWCIVGTLLPYPYHPDGPQAHLRSQKIFPAGAKLYVLGGFAGYDTVTVLGYAHRRRSPVVAHIKAAYIGGWRAQLLYRPVILRAIHQAAAEDGGHRWLFDYHEGRRVELDPTAPEAGVRLAQVAADFQQRLHGPPLGPAE